MFLPNNPLFFVTEEGSQGSANLRGDFGLSTVRDFLPFYTEVLYKIVSGLFVHNRPNLIGYLSTMQSSLSPRKGNWLEQDRLILYTQCHFSFLRETPVERPVQTPSHLG